MKVLVFLIGIAFACAASGRILDLHTEIRIAATGEVTVTERITLEGGEKSARLERELPAAAQVVALERNGQPEGYQVTYRALRRIEFLRDHDALHWNLKGAERVTAEVILPSAVPARSIRAEAAGGEYQSFVREGRAAFRALQPIALVVRFPKGVVAEPSVGERVRWFFSDYPGLLLVFAMLSLSAWVLATIRGQGRNYSPRRQRRE